MYEIISSLILFSRHDIHSKVGLQPSRPSASTQAVSSSSSSGLGSLARGQTGGQGDLGQEQEVTQDIRLIKLYIIIADFLPPHH